MRINVANMAKVDEVLDMVQGRCSARTITSGNVVDICEKVEARLGISKAAMDGIEVEADYHAQHFPGAYRYTPESTQISLVYKRGVWYLTDVRREHCKSPSKAIMVKLTEGIAIVGRAESFGI